MAQKNVLDFFEEILNIPRSSGKEEKIAGYLVHFAQKNHLEYYADKYSNVIIKKKGTLPYKCEPIILQAHTDMVCASDEEYDFDNKGIDWYIEDGYYKAKGTTLGADNGAGMAVILAILSDISLAHPPIEAVFTSQEETTMDGAKFLNYKKIKGKRLISLDGSEEDRIEVSSAGMASITIDTDIDWVEGDYPTYQITISGLLGGHSGVDIHKRRGNAIKILAGMLSGVDDIEIVEISGGSKENVIPSQAKCIFKTKHDLSGAINAAKIQYKAEFRKLKIDFKRAKQSSKGINKIKSKNIINFLASIEDGVLKKNEREFPLTSSNLGVITTTEDKVVVRMSIRSSIVGFEDYYISRSEKQAKKNKLNYTLEDRKPFFTFREESPLRQLLVDTYKMIFFEKITLEDVHAGLEGGIFAKEIDDLDMCVAGINLHDIHSVNEKAEIASIKNVYKWLTEALANME